jgi:lactoylglutathione lyase
MQFKLLVLRTSNPEKLADFYTLLGLNFDYHQHGNSPFHYSAMIGEMVLEIYPFTKSQTEADKNVRLGFSVDNFEETMAVLARHDIPFSTPILTDFGFVAVVSDSDGRKVELYKSSNL